MKRLSALLLAAAFCGWGAPGCALFHRRLSAKDRHALEVTQEEARHRPVLMGAISLVNAESRFVLIESSSSQLPESGLKLRTFSEGTNTGELRASGVNRRPFFVADVVSGNPGKGDLVMRTAGSDLMAQPKAPEAALAPALPDVDAPAAPVKKLPFWKRWLPGVRSAQ